MFCYGSFPSKEYYPSQNNNASRQSTLRLEPTYVQSTRYRDNSTLLWCTACATCYCESPEAERSDHWTCTVMLWHMGLPDIAYPGSDVYLISNKVRNLEVK